MGRNKEDNDSFRVRMDAAKRQYLAGEIISQGYYFVRDREKLPSFGRFLEDVADSIKKTNPVDTALNVVYTYGKSQNKKMSENTSLEQHLIESKAAALDSFTSQLFEILEARGFQSDEFLLSLSRYFGEQEEVVAALEKAAMALRGVVESGQ